MVQWILELTGDDGMIGDDDDDASQNGHCHHIS